MDSINYQPLFSGNECFDFWRRESMQTVDSTGKILLTFRSHDLSHVRGNSGGEQVHAWNLKMAQKYPSPVKNQTTDVYFTFRIFLTIVFKVQLNGVLKKL